MKPRVAIAKVRGNSAWLLALHFLSVAVVLGGFTTKAAAGPVPSFDIENAALMDAATSMFDYLPRLFGLGYTPVVFTSQIKPTGAFSFASVPGSTYNGLPLSLSLNSSYTSAQSSWSWTTQGAIGGVVVDATGYEKDIHLFGPYFFILDDSSWVEDGIEKDEESALLIRLANGGPDTIVGGFVHTIDGQPVDIAFDAGGLVRVLQNPQLWHWYFSFDHPASGSYLFNGTGFDDSKTGTGDFVIQVASVGTPEPSSLLLLSSGVLGLGAFLRKRLLNRS